MHQWSKEIKFSWSEKQKCFVEGCQFVFGMKPHLLDHINIKHIGYQAFLCETCGKGYSSAASFKSHQKSHQANLEKKRESCIFFLFLMIIFFFLFLPKCRILINKQSIKKMILKQWKQLHQQRKELRKVFF